MSASFNVSRLYYDLHGLSEGAGYVIAPVCLYASGGTGFRIDEIRGQCFYRPGDDGNRLLDGLYGFTVQGFIAVLDYATWSTGILSQVENQVIPTKMDEDISGFASSPFSWDYSINADNFIYSVSGTAVRTDLFYYKPRRKNRPVIGPLSNGEGEFIVAGFKLPANFPWDTIAGDASLHASIDFTKV